MTFLLKNEENWYLQDTSLENIYISEYMSNAPGDYVKVYIYALMLARMGRTEDDAAIARKLGMDKVSVENAWSFWQDTGAISMEGGHVLFHSLKGTMMPDMTPVAEAEPVEETVPEVLSPLADDERKWLYQAVEQICGKMLNSTEMNAIDQWLENLKADPEVILYAYTYCAAREKTSYRYVAKVLKSWVEEGLTDAASVEAYIGKSDERKAQYRRIFKAMGFTGRSWTEKEQKMMDTWLDEYGFEIDRILDACNKSSAIPNPNLNYVNKVLGNWFKEMEKTKGTAAEGTGKKISAGNVLRYYEYIREAAEKEAAEKRQEVYAKAPAIRKIDDRLKDRSILLSRMLAAMDKKGADGIRSEIDSLTVEKAYLLTENNFPPDYMEVKYRCEHCHDTGLDDDGNTCRCFAERTGEAVTWLKNQA